jgi:hypothetical protein
MRKAAPVLKAVGLLLFAMAIWRACVGVDWQAIARPNPLLLAALLAAILLNFALSALLVLWITRTFKPQPNVTYPLIVRLLLASSLLNYAGYFIPIGLVFRAGYLKTAHHVSLKDSAKTAALMFALSALACLGIVAALTLPLPPTVAWIGALLTLAIASALTKNTWARFAPDPAAGHPWLWLTLRLGEFATQGLRIWLSFKAVGADIDPAQALAIGAVAVLVGLASGMPSGLGVREWAMALSGAWLSVAASDVGLAAGLIDRACEVLIYLLLGGPSLLWFKRAQGVSPPKSTPQ